MANESFDILYEIFNYISLNDFDATALVCHSWRFVIHYMIGRMPHTRSLFLTACKVGCASYIRWQNERIKSYWPIQWVADGFYELCKAGNGPAINRFIDSIEAVMSEHRAEYCSYKMNNSILIWQQHIGLIASETLYKQCIDRIRSCICYNIHYHVMRSIIRDDVDVVIKLRGLISTNIFSLIASSIRYDAYYVYEHLITSNTHTIYADTENPDHYELINASISYPFKERCLSRLIELLDNAIVLEKETTVHLLKVILIMNAARWGNEPLFNKYISVDMIGITFGRYMVPNAMVHAFQLEHAVPLLIDNHNKSIFATWPHKTFHCIGFVFLMCRADTIMKFLRDLEIYVTNHRDYVMAIIREEKLSLIFENVYLTNDDLLSIVWQIIKITDTISTHYRELLFIAYAKHAVHKEEKEVYMDSKMFDILGENGITFVEKNALLLASEYGKTYLVEAVLGDIKWSKSIIQKILTFGCDRNRYDIISYAAKYEELFEYVTKCQNSCKCVGAADHLLALEI